MAAVAASLPLCMGFAPLAALIVAATGWRAFVLNRPIADAVPRQDKFSPG